ncbi:MAG: hypothetical protein RSD81_11090 [Pseudomonas sp.]
MFHITTPSNNPQRPRAIQAPINLAAPMPAKLPRLFAQVLDAIGT